MPWGWAALGAAAIAALLLLLQRLRPSPRTIVLPAAALWAEAMRDAPARTFDKRLRHWWAYLLALAIAVCLWMVFANPQQEVADSGAGVTLYLDASPASAPSAGAARAALVADAAALPAAGRTVVLGDGSGAVLLRPGEPIELLPRRLDDTTYDARPNAFERWLARAPVGTIRYYGHAAGLPAAMPERVAPGFLAEPVPGNRGIVALAAGPASSGDWERADVTVRAIDAEGEALSPEGLRFRRDGEDLAADRATRGADGSITLADLPADGSELTVSLRDGDGFEADDSATIALPLRRPARVALGSGVPALVAQTIARDPALVRADASEADVIVNGSGEGAKPSLRLTPSGDRIVFAGPGSASDLAASVDASGIAPWAARAGADGPAASASLEDSPARALTLPARLVSQNDDPAVQSARPILVSRALLWLAGRSDGDLLSETTAMLPGEETTRAVGQTSQVAAERPSRMFAWPSLVWWLGAALALLMVEWWLFTRRRMP